MLWKKYQDIAIDVLIKYKRDASTIRILNNWAISPIFIKIGDYFTTVEHDLASYKMIASLQSKPQIFISKLPRL